MPEAASWLHAAHRVLIVEDERAMCMLLSEILTDEGFEPVCVQTDRQAYDALRQGGHFDCMIVDVNLGRGTTGYDVARFARTIAPQVAVIYVSGQSSEASFRAHRVAGSLFLPKPFTPRELVDRLRMLVGDNDPEPRFG